VPHSRFPWVLALSFFACDTTITQQVPPANSRANARETAPASAPDSDVPPPPILLALPTGTSEAPKAKPVTRVEAEIIHTTSTAGLDAYVNQSVLPLIRANWYRLISKSNEKVAGDATLEFTILKDGTLGGTTLTEGAGHATLGDLALTAVKNSGPFPALPNEFAVTSLSIRARFRFEGGITEAATKTATAFPGLTVNVDGVEQPVYPVGGGVTIPQVVYQPEPEFSEEARRKKVSGIVMLRFILTTKGEPTDIRVTKSLGSGLDEKAIDAVRQWKFKPATKDGMPVSVQLMVEVDFHLANKGR